MSGIPLLFLLRKGTTNSCTVQYLYWKIKRSDTCTVYSTVRVLYRKGKLSGVLSTQYILEYKYEYKYYRYVIRTRYGTRTLLVLEQYCSGIRQKTWYRLASFHCLNKPEFKFISNFADAHYYTNTVALVLALRYRYKYYSWNVGSSLYYLQVLIVMCILYSNSYCDSA
jgi:hypothetical protein